MHKDNEGQDQPESPGFNGQGKAGRPALDRSDQFEPLGRRPDMIPATTTRPPMAPLRGPIGALDPATATRFPYQLLQPSLARGSGLRASRRELDVGAWATSEVPRRRRVGRGRPGCDERGQAENSMLDAARRPARRGL